MNKKIVVAGSALTLVASTIGVSALSGCKSNMTALNSDMPNAVSGSLKGEYVLEQIKVNGGGIGAEAIRAAVQKDAAAKAVFKGNAESQDALPINLTVDCVTKEANGGIACVNNVFALCTLTIWPWVSANENEYTVTASSVVGSHQVSFKVLDRSWSGLSPFALVPVPGWSDERGEDAELKQFHAAQIAAAAREACADLPNDYATFKKDQSNYLEMISQSRSAAAFSTFLAADTAKGKVDALTKVVNATVIAKHQNDLIATFKSISDGSVRAAILTKLNDGSYDKLPYDPTLISYWSKLGNARLLAMVYRDGYAKLSEADRKNLVAKITDDAVLTEMVTAPSREAQREAQNKREQQQRELKEKIAELQREAENHKRYAKSANENFRFGEAKRENKEAEKCMDQVAMLQKNLSALKNAKDDGLYIKNDEARFALFGRAKPETLAKIFECKDFAEQVPKEKRTSLNGAYGCTYYDVNPEVAKELLSPVADPEALFQISTSAELFAIRCAAIEKLSDDTKLMKIATCKMESCPYDTSLSGAGYGNGITWMTKTEEESVARLKKLAISKMKDATSLKQARKETDKDFLKKAVSERLAALGYSDVGEIVAYDKYDKDLFSMFAELKKSEDLTKVTKEAKLKGIRILAASKLDANVFAAVAKKELSASSAKPVAGKMVVGGYYLGMNIEDMFAKLAAENPDVKPTIYLDDEVLCIAADNERDIAWANAKRLDVHWIALPPAIVKQIAGFKSGSFEDLERAVEKKLGVSFGYDVIRKGNVSQKIGNLENTEGETLRYFISEIGEGEDISRTIRKAVNNNSVGSDPFAALGAGLANALEDAQQADENSANARRPMFQLPGSLQLLLTKNAAKGSLNSKGSFSKSGSFGAALKAAGELGQSIEEMKNAKETLGKAWGAAKGQMKDALKDAVNDKDVQDLKKSMDDLKQAADALNNLSL